MSLGFVANARVESGVTQDIFPVSPVQYFLCKVQLRWRDAVLASDDFLSKEFALLPRELFGNSKRVGLPFDDLF